MNAKVVIYGITAICYLIAGVLDLISKEWKLGILAVIYGIASAIIFLWR